MDFLLATTGSLGDVYPFVALGRGLAARGGRVALAAPSAFGPLVTGCGLSFVPLDKGEPCGEHPRLPPSPSHHPVGQLFGSVARPFNRRWRRLARASTIVPLLRRTYEVIASRHVPGRTVV